MKRIFFSIALSAILTLSFVFVACNRSTKEITPTATTIKQNVRNDKSLRNRTFGNPVPIETFKVDNCYPPAIECLPTITPNGGGRWASTLLTIEAGNTADIQSAFTSNKAVLLDYINEGAIDGVINGTLEVGMHGNHVTDPKFFLLFKNVSTQSPYETYPFEN